MKFYLKKEFDIKRIIFLLVMVSQAIALSIAESWIPDLVGIPGIEPGLANIVTIVTLVFFRYSDALAIILFRCIFTSLLMGGPVMFIFSICGSILSAGIMWLMLKSMKKLFSLTGICIAGSVVYNIGQLMAACFVMSDFSVTAYLRELMVYGIITGCFIGLCSTFMVKVLKKMRLIENL